MVAVNTHQVIYKDTFEPMVSVDGGRAHCSYHNQTNANECKKTQETPNKIQRITTVNSTDQHAFKIATVAKCEARKEQVY